MVISFKQFSLHIFKPISCFSKSSNISISPEVSGHSV